MSTQSPLYPLAFPPELPDPLGEIKSLSPADALELRILMVVRQCLCGSIPESVMRRIVTEDSDCQTGERNPFDEIIAQQAIDGVTIRDGRDFLRGAFPKALTDRFDTLQTYVSMEREVNQWLNVGARQAVVAWVRHALEHERELVLALMADPMSSVYAMDAFLLAGQTLGLPGFMDKRKYARPLPSHGLDSYLPRAVKAVRRAVESQAIADDDSMYIVALDALLGRASNLPAFALGMHCGRAFEAVAYLSKNCSADYLDDVFSCLPDDPTATLKSMLSHAAIPDACWAASVLLSQVDRNGQEALAHYGDDWKELFSRTVEDLEATIRDGQQTLKAAEQRARTAERSVKQLETAMERLEKGKESGTVKALKARADSLAREIDSLRNLVARRDARIANLEARLAGQAVAEEPVPDDTGAAGEAPAPAAAPLVPQAPKIPYEEALAQLQALRGVLVGGHTNFVNKIRPLLPGWSFFSNEEKRVDDALIANADLVVFFTASCSHTLTEPAMRLVRQHDKAHCYGTRINPPAFICEIASQARLSA